MCWWIGPDLQTRLVTRDIRIFISSTSEKDEAEYESLKDPEYKRMVDTFHNAVQELGKDYTAEAAEEVYRVAKEKADAAREHDRKLFHRLVVEQKIFKTSPSFSIKQKKSMLPLFSIPKENGLTHSLRKLSDIFAKDWVMTYPSREDLANVWFSTKMKLIF